MVSLSYDVGIAFALSTSAGLATMVGGCVVLSPKLMELAKPLSLAIALSISAGVMMFISLIEIFGKSVENITEAMEGHNLNANTANGHAWLLTTICFGAGIGLIYSIDWIASKISQESQATELENLDLVSEAINRPYTVDVEAQWAEIDTPDPVAEIKHEMDSTTYTSLVRMGVLTAIAIGLHNIPEGIATFVSSIKDPTVGASLAVGIGIHNIPEGVAVAAPIYFATRSRSRAILWCFLSAIAEPFGAVFAWLAIGDGMNLTIEGVLLGIVCGIMVCISMKELLPTAFRFASTRPHLVAIGTFIGMVIMAISLALFAYAGV